MYGARSALAPEAAHPDVEHGALVLHAVEVFDERDLRRDADGETAAHVEEQARREVEQLAARIAVERSGVVDLVLARIAEVELGDDVDGAAELPLVGHAREERIPVAIAVIVLAGEAVAGRGEERRAL